MKDINEFFAWAKSNNWQIELSANKKQFPSEILQRYINIPNDYEIFYDQIDLCVGPIGKSWFLTEQDFSAIDTEGISTIFAWNTIEKMILESAADDAKLIQEVDEFWKLHLPCEKNPHKALDTLQVSWLYPPYAIPSFSPATHFQQTT